uniref:Large ribosomal subunit protein bL21 n=1 Tax=candidate division WOR-3 bacterium TaxID=2052148 RepID=A0A7V4E229_UNCW3
MWAFVEYKGAQFYVKENENLIVPLTKGKAGEKIEIDKVIMIKKDGEIKIGTPYIEGAKVEAEIIEHIKLPKIIVFKYKPKKNYRRKKGHRQKATKIKILKIEI